ncbi:uncharacterized protein LOC124161351 [Ischnura elegans]|uniref:uncharacterized protein LOC124161351 n=1 Tax=Ischnura elegans TaxID=197161 RepID=UPI001ED8AF7C|nr:uncharacterized protein LOC124161351 [Ischnura elegans]
MAAPGLLVISDSQWKYAVPEVQEFGEFDVSVIPVSGMQVHQVDSTMLLATEFFNDTVVHLGTNNLICGETPERVVEHQQELLTRIRLRNPKVRLFLSSVLKRRVNYFKSWTLQRNLYIEAMNLKIDKLNMLMKQLALRMNVVFIDNWREFEAQSQDPFEFFLGRDGLHLSRRGLRVLTGNVYRACLQARRDYPRSLACLPPAPSPASSPAPSPASSPAPSPASSSAPSPGHHPLPSPSFSDGAGMNASLPSFSYSDALCSNLPLHNDLMQVSSFQPSVRPLHLPSVTRTNASSYSSPPLSPSSSTPSCFKFTTVTRRGNHHCNKPKIVPKHSSSFKIPLNNRWSSLSSLNDSFMPSFSSVANCTKKQSCIKKKSISPKMFPSSAFCRPSSLPLISDVRNTNKDGTTKEFPARLCRQIGFKLKNPLTDRLTIKIQNGGSSEGKLDIHSTLYPRKCPNCNKVYANKSSFCHHKATCLRIEKSDSNISYPRVCQICLVSYSNKCNYSRHKKTCNEKSQYIVCPHDGCNVKFQSHSILICHLQSVHQEDICVEDHEFKDMFDFNAWKTSQCQLNYMSLFKHNGERVNRGKRFMYFICKFNNHHKNGIVSNKTNRKRKFGRMPNSDCIARMLVNESESGVSVKYVNAHNHDLEFKNVKFYRWDNATKYKINSLLEQSVPAHKIQEYFQPADPSLNEMLPLKEHFITSTQINKMKYDLNSKKHLSDDDAVAVDLIVHLMKDENKLFKSVSTSKDCKLEHINVQHSHAIGQHLDKLKILSQQCSPVLLPYISKSLKLLVETCQGAIECNQSNSTLGTLSAHDVPPNAKLSPQLKLHPAIKKRRPMVNLFKRPGYVRRKDIKISLLSNEVSSFTEPIVDVASLSMEVCKVGSFSVKMYELKSLDFLIPPEEVSAIHKVFPDFKRGWLYDTIIAAFLWKIAESVPSVFSVDPVISQYVTGKISQSRPMAIFGKSDLSCVTRIVIPLNVCNSHWMLIVALPLERKLEFYDPAADVIHHTNNFAIQRWIKVLSVSFGCTERDWEVSSPEHFKQRDSHNCGVFICWYAERIIQGRLIKEPFDADKYRKYMFDMITVLDN